ncbi:MAG: hypothetical protein GY862_12360 [Gammaproteobacteria bacterium]|nr:hypothetical protein [Gammaproteobacteria bacterium]
MQAIKGLDEGVQFGSWDFSGTEPALQRLDPAKQKTARRFVDFFSGKLDRNEL